MEECYFLLKGALFHWCFSRFLNWTNGIKARKASHLINPFMHNVVKWPNILQKSCGVNTARYLKYVWPFYNIMHERVKTTFLLVFFNFIPMEVTQDNWKSTNIRHYSGKQCGKSIESGVLSNSLQIFKVNTAIDNLYVSILRSLFIFLVKIQ